MDLGKLVLRNDEVVLSQIEENDDDKINDVDFYKEKMRSSCLLNNSSFDNVTLCQMESSAVGMEQKEVDREGPGEVQYLRVADLDLMESGIPNFKLKSLVCPQPVPQIPTNLKLL